MSLWTKLKDLVEGVDADASRAGNLREEELRLASGALLDDRGHDRRRVRRQ